jgi:hypothetical protein
MVFVCRMTRILALHHNQRSKLVMKGNWPALTMALLVYFVSVVDWLSCYGSLDKAILDATLAKALQ